MELREAAHHLNKTLRLIARAVLVARLIIGLKSCREFRLRSREPSYLTILVLRLVLVGEARGGRVGRAVGGALLLECCHVFVCVFW